MTNATFSRILVFVPEPDLEPTVSAIAAAADSEPSWGEMTRSDGTTAPQGVLQIDRTRIEVTGGETAAPAVVELTVPDPEAAAERAAEASGYEAKSTMLGWAVKAPGLTIALRSA